MVTLTITQTPIKVLSEYHLIRDGETYFIFHRINGTCKRRAKVTCAEAFDLYGRLHKAHTIGESYRNVAAVGCFEPGDWIRWAMTAWVWEGEELPQSVN